MHNLKGFWSYVHTDDEADSERISRLARDVADQFQMITGETITLFLDKDDIEWGENWRDKIDASLASVAFFIPVMTPRYFMSPECRREMQYFTRKATNLGIKELVLPLLYVNVPSIDDESNEDDLIKIVRTFQWEDWRELRFMEVTSEGYRRGVFRLANRLAEANRHVEERDIAATSQEITEIPSGAEDDSPGFIDRLAIAEETLPKWQETLVAIRKDIELIGNIMNEGTADIQRGNTQGKGFAARLIVARRLAQQLVEPTEHIWSLSNKSATQLHEVDEGFRIIIGRAPLEIQENPDSKTSLCTFFRAVRSLSTSAHDGLGSVQRMIDTIPPIERMSRDMRPALRRLKQGLAILVESRDITDEWVNLIEVSGVACEDQDAQPH